MSRQLTFLPSIGVLLFAFGLLISPSVHAQTGQGQIVGSVTDSTGAMIPGVSVGAVNTATRFTYSSQTNEQGLYRTPYLNPGMYEITFEADGFKRLVRSNIQVRSTETVRVNIEMEIGTRPRWTVFPAWSPSVAKSIPTLSWRPSSTTWRRSNCSQPRCPPSTGTRAAES